MVVWKIVESGSFYLLEVEPCDRKEPGFEFPVAISRAVERLNRQIRWCDEKIAMLKAETEEKFKIMMRPSEVYEFDSEDEIPDGTYYVYESGCDTWFTYGCKSLSPTYASFEEMIRAAVAHVESVKAAYLLNIEVLEAMRE
jgi:hypothetical protein